MKTNETYNSVYRTIALKLQKIVAVNGYLSQSDIDDSIKAWKEFMKQCEKLDPNFLKVPLMMDDQSQIDSLDEQDWFYLKNTLEQEFVVKVETGILIQGEKKDRDKSWWTSKRKIECDNYYNNNYMNYSLNNLPAPVLNVIDEDTDAIMNNLGDPMDDNFSIRGMVVGHVQSGKTANYASLLCKAADAGYKFIVVIAGAQNNLRNQTQSRLEEIFVGRNSKGVGSLKEFDRAYQPTCLTSIEHDFKKQLVSAHATTNFESNPNPILIVIKKITSTLDHLLSWLNDNYPNTINESMLVIDDESDYASINTNKEEDPTTINKKIRELLAKFGKASYVAYTATPFANIFIDHKSQHILYGEDLFPSDFIYALKAPDNYFGAEAIFGDESEKYIVQIPEDEVMMESDKEEENGFNLANDKFLIKHKKDYILEDLPNSLYDAVNHFLLNIGIRNLKNQRGKHNSMLVHISRLTDVHIQIKFLIKTYVEKLKIDVKAYGKMNRSSWNKNIIGLMDTFNRNLKESVQFTFESVLEELADVIHTIQIIDVHQRSKFKLEYRSDRQTNVIAIGGLSLSRGYTLEGLSVSYFMRSTTYYDTLMQMGRWFGYRIGYQEICRVYVTEEMQKKFKFILLATEELLQRLNQMKIEQLTPKDFGLAVIQHPDSLVQVTARNKAKNANEQYIDMDLSGTFKETSFISNKVSDIDENEDLLSSFVKKIQSETKEMEIINNSYVWRNVAHKNIKDFVGKYRFYPHDELGLRSRLPVAVIKQHLIENVSDWDVVLYSGKSDDIFKADNVIVKRQKRSVTVGKEKRNDGYYEFKKSMVSRSNPERILMGQKYKSYKASEIRPIMKNPVLFIHAMELIDANTEEFLVYAVALSFSFNGTGTGKKATKILINNVMKQELIEYASSQVYEEEYEDE
ncbi:Z1 domain-containing protein [Sporosarcina aquimarina]|uniref:Z1 domain-containing protein n=1 Tax=Sporosarcina aquimarina TaxID=114975 RepID=A0ABU4G430_9BACL|nr:Z1 domain-containing protein [Sporosarcina aquimarina]MDW0111137.1 Z1 domain-containing protein [Sporosarcina aquimarina]